MRSDSDRGCEPFSDSTTGRTRPWIDATRGKQFEAWKDTLDRGMGAQEGRGYAFDLPDMPASDLAYRFDIHTGYDRPLTGDRW